MLKHQELADPNSHLNRAADDEPIFVLRGWDVSFVAVVRAWIGIRRLLIATGIKPQEDMRHVLEAEALCQIAEEWRYNECIRRGRDLANELGAAINRDVARDISSGRPARHGGDDGVAGN